MNKILIGIGLLTAFSCTDNSRARNWGGTEEIQLKENHTLLGVTWKENNMWILTKDTVTDINYFKEKSNWGTLEGTIIIK